MYPGGHTVMYATSTPSLADGSLTVLNTFPPTGHTQSHDPGKVYVRTPGMGLNRRGIVWFYLLIFLAVSRQHTSFAVVRRRPTGLPRLTSSSRWSDPGVCSPAPPGKTKKFFTVLI